MSLKRSHTSSKSAFGGGDAGAKVDRQELFDELKRMAASNEAFTPGRRRALHRRRGAAGVEGAARPGRRGLSGEGRDRQIPGVRMADLGQAEFLKAFARASRVDSTRQRDLSEIGRLKQNNDTMRQRLLATIAERDHYLAALKQHGIDPGPAPVPPRPPPSRRRRRPRPRRRRRPGRSGARSPGTRRAFAGVGRGAVRARVTRGGHHANGSLVARRAELAAAVRVTLIRHGEAGDDAPARRVARADRARAAPTPPARAARSAGRGGGSRSSSSSPLVRAVQTAEIVAAAVDYRGRRRDSERPAACRRARSPRWSPFLRPLAGEDSIALVAHEPILSALAAALLGSLRYPALRKAEALRLRLPEGRDGPGELRWRIDPDTGRRESLR